MVMYVLIKLVDQTLIIRTNQYSFHIYLPTLCIFIYLHCAYIFTYIVHSFGEGITTFESYTQHIPSPQDPRMISFFCFLNTIMCGYAWNDNITTVSSAGDSSTNYHQWVYLPAIPFHSINLSIYADACAFLYLCIANVSENL